jgi:hypothetical protein
MANLTPEMILEIAKVIGSLSLGTVAIWILAWQSPKLLDVFLTFIRNVLKDWRSRPKAEKQLKTPQISKPQ